jgi:hypothetical protein
MSADQGPALFGVDEVRRAQPSTVGTVERSLHAALGKALEEGRLLSDVDGPLAESAMVLARTLDTADAIGGIKGGYLASQAQPALQKALHALRLPVEVTAAAGVPLPGNSPTGAPDWVGDAFGRPE